MSANRQPGKGNVGARRRQGGLAVVYHMRRAPAAFLQVRDQGSNPLPLARTKGADAIMAHPTQGTNPIPAELAALLAPRILRRVKKRRDGCWVRYVNVNPVSGYTSITRKADGRKRYYLAHRIMYVFANGPIPEGLTVDHRCENRACCNPAHLRVMSIRENVLRSRTNPYAINARKKTCKRGHEFAEKNGRRYCPICRGINAAARRKARRAKKLPSAVKHGTQGGYHYWACRCDECKAWQRADYLARKAARAA